MQTKKLAVLLLGLGVAGASPAQQKPQAPGFPDAPGKETLVNKCFQCHTPSMWIDHRQDRKGWEGTLYRMVGRGALWTEDEIKAMADYLGAVYGGNAGRKQ
jgi:hypothetical protein